jgi:putative thioredoxin
MPKSWRRRPSSRGPRGCARSYLETGKSNRLTHPRSSAGGQAQPRPRWLARAALRWQPSRPAALGPIGELEKKVAANPLDHQARFDLALALNGHNRRQEALDHLMEIVRRDRKWNDDGARKQLVQFFEAWGPTDEFTVAGRRSLSSILFA